MLARNALGEPVLHLKSHSPGGWQLSAAFRGKGSVVGCNVASFRVVGIRRGSILEVSDKGQWVRIKALLRDGIRLGTKLHFHVSSVVCGEDEADGHDPSRLKLTLYGEGQVVAVERLGMVVVVASYHPTHC